MALLKKRNSLFVTWHLGLGDVIACRGIVKFNAGRYRRVWLGAKPHNLASTKLLFSDLPNVRVISLGSKYPERNQVLLSKIFSSLGASVLRLGYYGDDYLVPPFEVNFDENFYTQAKVSFEGRVEGTSFPRALELERQLEHELGDLSQPYIFIHDDPRRNLVIDQDRILSPLRQIRSDLLGNRFPISAWTGVIMRASELHVIESSFAALIESLDPPGKKVAHRYARQLVLDRPEMQWTYQTEWAVEW